MVEFREASLPNGLKIIAEADPNAHSAAVGFFVRTGARDEEPADMGVSHFLEHMMFKGTDTLDADAINRGYDRLGARNNAYTTTEMTCFYASVLPGAIEEATKLTGTMMRPALRTSDFDTEKGVILEEIAMYQDNPFWSLYEQAMAHHYRDAASGTTHGLGHRVLGTSETVSAMSADRMRSYFESRYSADNTTVALAGAVDFDRAVDWIGEVCGSWQTTGPGRGPAKTEFEPSELALTSERVSRGYLLWLAPGPGVASADRYASALLMQVLGGSDNSRLHWSLIETGLAEEAQASMESHDGVGDQFIYASGDPERLGEIRGVVEREAAGLAASLTEDDLEKLRSRFATAFTVGGERPGDRMQRIGRRWATLGEYTTLEQELEKIRAVTLDDLRRVASTYPLDRRTLATLTPEASG
ncbi:MAG: pitrilysin family protein [Planctomycetota bacterium]